MLTTEQTIHVNNEAGTRQVAMRLASFALDHPGTVLALDGDLGAGKTKFSQLFAQSLGVPGVVNSPTFTIIKEYEAVPSGMPFYHMDVYRLSLAEADELGLDDYFFGAGTTIVEWASLIKELLPERYLAIQLEHEAEAHGSEQRIIRMTAHGEPYVSWLATLAQEVTTDAN